jgi:hypothetical protein
MSDTAILSGDALRLIIVRMAMSASAFFSRP